MRAKNIFSKIIRNLQSYGLQYQEIMDKEIYQEMSIAQDKIISEIYSSAIITIELKAGVSSYPLTTDLPNANVKRQNIGSIKVINYPAGWNFEIKSHDDYATIINSTNAESLGNTKVCTVINNKFHIYPIPTEEEEGISLKMITYLASSKGAINETTDPEVPELFDKAIELYATSQFLGKERVQFLSEFAQELQRLAPKFKVEYNLVRKPIEGWW